MDFAIISLEKRREWHNARERPSKILVQAAINCWLKINKRGTK